MPGLADLAYSFAERAGHLALEHVSDGLKAKRKAQDPAPAAPSSAPRLLTLADLPQRAGFVALDSLGGLSILPSLGAATAPVTPPVPQTPAVPDNYSESYAEEFGMTDDASPVACWPCTRRHVSTSLVAAEEGMSAQTAEERRAAAATILGEVGVWRRYDVTPEKLAATSPDRRAAVEAAMPGMRAAADALPAGPANLPLAWSASVEAYRFANSRGGNPSPMERRECDLRMEDVQGWVGYLDTLPLSPTAAPHLAALRAARHKINREGNTPAAVAEMRDALRAAAVALTPEPSPETLRQAHEHLRQARSAFLGQAKVAMRQARQDRAPNPLAGRVAFEDHETRIPARYAAACTPAQPDDSPFLGATRETRTAFERLVQFCEARFVPVRDYPIPPEPADGGVDIIFGAYLPEVGNHGQGTILLGPQVVAEAPHDVETIGEETAHSLLHNVACNPYPRSQTARLPYDEQPEEREAKLANMIALQQAAVPFETDLGQRINPRAVTLDIARLEATEEPRIVRRAQWAGTIMAQAIKGDVAGAVAVAQSGCPR